MDKQCLLCGAECSTDGGVTTGHTITYHCPECGDFSATHKAVRNVGALGQSEKDLLRAHVRQLSKARYVEIVLHGDHIEGAHQVPGVPDVYCRAEKP